MTNKLSHQQLRDMPLVGLSKLGSILTMTHADGSEEQMNIAPDKNVARTRLIEVATTGGQHTNLMDAVAASTFGNVIQVAPGSYGVLDEVVNLTQLNTTIEGYGATRESHATVIQNAISTIRNRTRLKDIQLRGAYNMTSGEAHASSNVVFEKSVSIGSCTNFIMFYGCVFSANLNIAAGNTAVIYLIECKFAGTSQLINSSPAPVIAGNVTVLPGTVTGSVLKYGVYGSDYYFDGAKTPSAAVGTDSVMLVGADGKAKSRSKLDFKQDLKSTFSGSSLAAGTTNIQVSSLTDKVNKYSIVGTYSGGVKVGIVARVLVDKTTPSNTAVIFDVIGTDNSVLLTASISAGELVLTLGSSVDTTWNITSEI